MWFSQNVPKELHSLSNTIFDFLKTSKIGQHLSREAQRIHYVPLHLQSSKGSSVLQSKARRSFIVSLGLLTIFLLTFVALHSRSPGSLYASNFDALASSGTKHPILQLVNDADARCRSRQQAQSKDLREAVTEYRRRYSLPPPPNFDLWYAYAVAQGTELIDDFDSIHESLLPYWAVEPKILRNIVQEVLGQDNALMGVAVRNGSVIVVGEGQDDFQASGTQEMITPFAHMLPDMDLAFNTNDEPRIMIPHEDMSRLLSLATTAIEGVQPTSHSFTRPGDLENASGWSAETESRFNHLDQQQTWSFARMSCAPETPARSFDPEVEDAQIAFTFDGISFVRNITAFTDVCLSPSLRSVVGIFNRPNALAISNELIPIFSPSKLSVFQDIIYPSPYYYTDRATYDNGSLVGWEQKEPDLFWRGATSGGYIRNGSWKQLLRTAVLSKLKNKPSSGPARVLVQNPKSRKWTAAEILVDPQTAEAQYNTKFTEFKQCDVEDCEAMRAFFGDSPRIPQEEAWKHRYLLDLDGNALSGRFYALMKSLSVPMKVAYFREWHTPRLFPWKHYVPLSATTDEYPEVLRYFEEDEMGREIAKRIGEEGRRWAGRTLRKEDMEVYMFRLLLEYGRLIDDNRHKLGFQL